MRCQSKEFVLLKNYLKRIIIFCFRTRANEGKEREDFLFFLSGDLSLLLIYMCESVCGTPPVRTFAVFFFERYAKMWTQRRRRPFVRRPKNTKKGGDTKKDQKKRFW